MDQNQTRASGFIDTLWEEDDYLEDIIDHLAYMEDVTLPSILMIEKQEQITWDLRSNLIDFVTRSHQHFRLPSHVLFLSINLIDRYCSRKQVFEEHYWLLGSVALFVASKYGDKTDRGRNLIPLANGSLNLVHSRLGDGPPDNGPLPGLLLVGEPRGGELASMAAYLSEISLYHPEFAGIKPSVIATSCCMLAKSILFGTVSIGTNTEIVVMETLNSLWKRLRQPPPAISDKYSTQSQHYVAQTVFYRLAG
ncbi:uncharacterized protein FPOAC1_014038 [Fusarium poae]|uniref:uncharacterized protein n=1 Tax=Fusarium poae TaxID=36050 RepID=UPI001D053B86|nr:uncharacterized protein FPOAC1_014038 [Fusarium poae]KAG8664145.1 hypothetical protein FPOAC1_014038 [Fusarium poae]